MEQRCRRRRRQRPPGDGKGDQEIFKEEGRGGKKTAEIAALRLLRAGKAQIMHIMDNFMDIFLGRLSILWRAAVFQTIASLTHNLALTAHCSPHTAHLLLLAMAFAQALHKHIEHRHEGDGQEGGGEHAAEDHRADGLLAGGAGAPGGTAAAPPPG